MRRTRALLVSAFVLPTLALGTGSPASAAGAGTTADEKPAAAQAAKQVTRSYGGNVVRLAPRQGVDVAFRARKGDQVMLDVSSRTSTSAPCFGTQTITDARGRRSARIYGDGSARIVAVRVTGRTVLSFRGYCSDNKGQAAHPQKVQLTKVRMREAGTDGRVAVRKPRRGFLDVAYVTVARHGRDTLTLRDANGRVVTYRTALRRGRTLQGNRLLSASLASQVSVEAGERVAYDALAADSGRRLRAGERIGLAVPTAGHAESLRARVHRVSLDGPAVTLDNEPGREHVLVYPATADDRAYLVPSGLTDARNDPRDPSWFPWDTYAVDEDRKDSSPERRVVASAPDGAGAASIAVRARRTVRVADLVVGGAPVSFASVEPGTRFVATIPASAAGTVRLTASPASATGPWTTWVPPVVCARDCSFPGLTVTPTAPVADGTLFAAKPHELEFFYGWDATGSVTLQLTDNP